MVVEEADDQVWALAMYSKGIVYAATGSKGRIVKITGRKSELRTTQPTLSAEKRIAAMMNAIITTTGLSLPALACSRSSPTARSGA